MTGGDPKYTSKHNTLHWDRISNFSLFCHQNVSFVFVNLYFLVGSAAFYIYIAVPVSKHDLKHFSKSDIFGFAGGVSMDFCSRRATKLRLYNLKAKPKTNTNKTCLNPNQQNTK